MADRKKQRRAHRVAKREDRRRMFRENILRVLRKLGFDLTMFREQDLHDISRPRRAKFPLFVVDPKAQEEEPLEALREEILESLGRETEIEGIPVSTLEFFEGLSAVMDAIKAKAKAVGNESWFGDLFGRYQGVHELFVGELVLRVLKVLVNRSRLDGSLFSFSVEQINPPGEKKQEAFVLKSGKADERRFFLPDEGPRTALRAGGVTASGTVEWVTWKAEKTGLKGPDRPVWIQPHAIERLRERIPAPSLEGGTHSSVFASLYEPNFAVRQSERELLVEFRWHGVRLGYLPATVLDDAVVVRTFKFLTMSGTPESAKLRERLRLGRKDIEYLDLDSLGAFILSDLGKDPQLRKIFVECGCGHLFDLVKEELEPEIHIADDVRRYLRMGPAD